MLSYAYDKNKPNKEDADIFKKFIQRIIEAENREDAMQNVFYGNDGIDIAFRLVCFNCYEKLMAKGYDGQYYDEADECLDEDY